MIVRFRHQGLRRLYERGDGRLLPSRRVGKIERILARLDVATEPASMNLPGFRLHPLRGNLVGFWAVSVSGNWRIVFRFEAGNIREVDLVDYH
ncbi:MAG: type II toxin-antitoxin system RelE/ParE family toxin [Chloroflexi bacterium]|nr:type II toxin-antitoxin system RelE/ParE family toxin [Chloroflexota bacterium]